MKNFNLRTLEQLRTGQLLLLQALLWNGNIKDGTLKEIEDTIRNLEINIARKKQELED